jgi:glyoxylase-like metal-dependent hydrolase (beta-lactamase superfamily II)
MNKHIPLEDKMPDILGKAMRGLQLSVPEVAARSGVSEAAVEALCEGAFQEEAVRAVAPVLGLSTEALIASGKETWHPEPRTINGLQTFNTAFDDMTVNSYLAVDRAAGTAVAFDTGADSSEMMDFLSKENLSLKLILITHSHPDHIADLTRLQTFSGAQVFTSTAEPVEGAQQIEAGGTFSCGALKIESRLTWGHSRGGLTFVVSGLEHPVAVVGDAIFAGSMGGGRFSFQDALRTNRSEILSLPADTILCPGHGPLTTVGEEKAHNPFFAA